jgi:hypothetical protein
MGNRRAISVLGTVALLACACTGHNGASTGVLTGIARACSGLAYVPTANLQVYRGDVLVAAKRVPDNTTYRFVLSPGRYYITNTGTSQRPLGHSVSVSAGDTTHTNVPNDCE